MKSLIIAVLAAWFALVVILAACGLYARTADSPPLPILVSAVIPLLVFFVAYSGANAFRSLVRNADLRLLTAVQAWRAGGLGFLALSAHGILPSQFAWPAGWGDIAIGVTAPWVMLAIVRRPAFVSSRTFIIWNALGILDLVVAVSAGVLSSGYIHGVVGQVTTAPMGQLPLVIVPAYLVPLFVMLHITALIQARRNAVAGESAQPSPPLREAAFGA